MNKPTKRTFLKCAAVSGLVAITAMSSNLIAAPQADKNLPTPEQTLPTGKTVQYLFVQTAHSISSKGDQLTLHGVGPGTLFFSDRPERITGHSATEEWVKT